MTKMSHVLLAALVAFEPAQSLRTRSGMWGPPDLKTVETALESILKVPMTPEHTKMAEHVAGDVRADIAALSTGKLSKEDRKLKVSSAIKELGDFQGVLQKQESQDDSEKVKKMASLEKELAAKKAELAMEEKEIQLVKLKKELAEKELQLNNLKSQKERTQVNEEDTKERDAMIANLVGMSKTLHGSKAAAAANSTTSIPPEVATILSKLQSRSKKLEGSIAKLTSDEKASEQQLDGVSKGQVPTKGKDDAISRGQSLIRNLKKQEHRKFEKARVLKKRELTEINNAIHSIETGNVKELTQTLQKMQAEYKTLNANGDSFLH